jgi:CelD/BcsL family acetyltransferase involved in cellulose biosynthesis
VHGCSDTWDWFLLAGLPTHLAHGRAFERFSDVQWGCENPNYELPLPATWVELKRGLSRNGRESLRKCCNSLKREGIEFAFNVVRARERVPEAIEHFLRLHTARADRTDTVAHADVFKEPNARRFLADVCQRFADRDALRIFQIAIGGTVVATRVGFVVGDSLYLYYSGYDPEFSRFSIMTTVVAEAIQYAIDEGFRTVNLSSGRDFSKDRWRPREVVYRDVEIVSPTLRGRLGHRSYAFAKSGLAGLVPGLTRGGSFAKLDDRSEGVSRRTPAVEMVSNTAQPVRPAAGRD